MGNEDPFETLLSDVAAGDIDLSEWAESLSWSAAASLDSRVEQELGRLPVPIGPLTDGPVVRRRRALERVGGRLRARHGDMAALLAAERTAWLRGGRHLDYLRVLVETGRDQEAAALSRTLLARRVCPEREAIRVFLDGLSRPPEGWAEAVAAFAEEPSLGAWEALWRFTPEELIYERKRYTIDLLERFGVDPEIIFRCATHGGITPDAVALAERGAVEPRLIEARAEESTPEGRPLWLGLAARAACVRGDRLGAVRLIKAALAQAREGFEPSMDVDFLRDRGDAELQEMLDRAGVPGAEHEEMPDGEL